MSRESAIETLARLAGDISLLRASVAGINERLRAAEREILPAEDLEKDDPHRWREAVDDEIHAASERGAANTQAISDLERHVEYLLKRSRGEQA
jgi:hypothetical protein